MRMGAAHPRAPDARRLQRHVSVPSGPLIQQGRKQGQGQRWCRPRAAVLRCVELYLAKDVAAEAPQGPENVLVREQGRCWNQLRRQIQWEMARVRDGEGVARRALLNPCSPAVDTHAPKRQTR